MFTPTSAYAFLFPVGRILYSCLGPRAQMTSRDVLKVSVLHYKDPSKTDEEFEKHVTENINPAWIKLVKRHEFMKYSIVSVSSLLTSLVHNYALSDTRLHYLSSVWLTGT